MDDVSVRPSKLIQTELKSRDVDTLTTSHLQQLRKNLSRSRLAIFPKIPKTFGETHDVVDKLAIISNKGENLLSANDRKANIILFTTSINLSALSEMDQIFIDGTFYSCSKPFKQVFIIHDLHKNIFMPLAFFLLPDKSSSTYERAFQIILERIGAFNLSFNPSLILADFEKSIHKALNRVFPRSKIIGCRFHLGQSCWRKIQDLGLAAEYRTNNDLSNFLKIFIGLPLLPVQEVSDCFTDDIMSILPDDKRVVGFCDYVLENYIEPNSPFPPEIWAQHSETTRRTTNNCESFHSKLNAMFNSANPNLFQFLEALKSIQTDIFILNFEVQ
ncbi:uncharacterized protein [Chelonus insularis]|uniref:uncharacterized protein n=1 Tax=Chelonus insularis TaxID=460826 RepID=UPI00158B4689|nr:uncharacterized protein LOC118066843 [Chelonus insularis]